MLDLNFYKNKTILITGHTGFKGAWLSKILINAGAKVIGYSLQSPTNPSVFSLLELDKKMTSIIGDIRDFDRLYDLFVKYRPEIVFHLAAQPIVRTSYEDPVYTYSTNVMGTVNLLECIRKTQCTKSVLNVTTDKVYLNNENANKSFKEEDPLDGFDPYSNSKSCSELVTHSYIKAFFNDMDIRVSTARAGNVLGGGDFSRDRIIPDCIRAALNNEDIIVRNPHSTRPYQHVLEPLYVYLLIASKQYEDKAYCGYYNVGPDECDCVSTGDLVDIFCKSWTNIKWINKHDGGPHEASFLKLDCSKIKEVFNWAPTWHIDKCIEKVCQWTKVYMNNGDISSEMDKEIAEFMGGKHENN